MNKLTAQIVNDFPIREQAQDCVREFREAGMKKLFSQDEEKYSDPRFLALWDLVDQKNFNDLVEQTEQEIAAIAVLTIYAPVQLGSREALLVAEYVRQNFPGDYLVDIRLDSTLIAGCALVWKGKYGDFSLKQKMIDNREEIRKVVLNS